MSATTPAGIVLVTSRSFSSGELDLTGELERAGLTVVRGAVDHDLERLQQPLADAVAWIAGVAPVRAEHLALAPNLRVLARYGVGYDAVDLTAAVRAGVTVTNTPGANSDAVAEHALALALAALRGVAGADARVRSGDWTTSRGRQLSGATAGVVGFGRIGRGLAKRLTALGCRVHVADPYVDPDEITAAACSAITVDELSRTCDIISLHAPGGQEVVGTRWVQWCRQGQVIVNTARADLVNEACVADALRAKAIGAYAADMLRSEGTGEPSPLLAPDLADRVTVTPHLGAQTIQAVDGMGRMAVTAVRDVLDGRTPEHVVR